MRDKFFFISPSFITHIPATMFVPERFDMSKHSIFLGILFRCSTSLSSVSTSYLSFDLLSNVIFALFSAISTKRSFSPLCGVFISTFLPASFVSHSCKISFSSISFFIIILLGSIVLPI